MGLPGDIGSPSYPDPMWPLSNTDMYNTALALRIACGRNRSVLRKKHREHLCYLAELLNPEFEHRKYPGPHWPYSA